MDCCHSGTNSRFAPLDRTRARGDERRRFLELTPDLEEAHRRFRARAGSPSRASHEESLPGVVHFAACLDNEYAYESAGQGHFTRVATGLLASAVSKTQTNEAFARDVERQVVAIGRPQTPRMMPLPVGSTGRSLLAASTRDADANDDVSVLPPAGSTAVTFADRALAEWWLEFFENGATQLRQRLGR